MKPLASLAAVVVAAALCAPASARAAANLLTNGDFETGDFSGWQLSGEDEFTLVEPTFLGITPAGGQFQAVLGSRGGDDLEQEIATVVGERYRIQFDLANSGPGPNFVTVFFDDQHETLCAPCAAADYEQFTWDVTATFADNDLDFNEANRDFWFYLDNVSVTELPSGAPEPASWTLMIVGFGAAGAVLRRRPRTHLA